MDYGELMSRVEYLSDEVREVLRSDALTSNLEPLDRPREAFGYSSIVFTSCCPSLHGSYPRIKRRTHGGA